MLPHITIRQHGFMGGSTEFGFAAGVHGGRAWNCLLFILIFFVHTAEAAGVAEAAGAVVCVLRFPVP